MAVSSSQTSAAVSSASKQGISDIQAVSKAQVEMNNVTIFAKFMKTAEDGAQSAL